MKLSEPMRRELSRIAQACKGRGRRGARQITNLNTYRALERRGLVFKFATLYGKFGFREVIRPTYRGKQLAKQLGLVFLMLLLATGCTMLSYGQDGVLDSKTFGTASVSVTTDADGIKTVEAGGDGTNIASILEGLWDAAKGLFGGGGDTVVNVGGDTNQAEEVPTE